jgi:hypothetical protein
LDYDFSSFSLKSLSFDQIKTTELNDKKLIVTKTNGNKVTFDFNGVTESDIHKLNEIIMKNTIANTVYNLLLASRLLTKVLAEFLGR